MDKRIKVAIADDHDRVRAGIKSLLCKAEDISVVAEAANGREALNLARKLDLDVLLLDFDMPEMRGDEVVNVLRAEDCDVKVLVISAYDDLQFIKSVLDNGAQGFVTKEEAVEMLVEAVRRIAAGTNRWISPRAAQRISKPSSARRPVTPRTHSSVY